MSYKLNLITPATVKVESITITVTPEELQVLRAFQGRTAATVWTSEGGKHAKTVGRKVFEAWEALRAAEGETPDTYGDVSSKFLKSGHVTG